MTVGPRVLGRLRIFRRRPSAWLGAAVVTIGLGAQVGSATPSPRGAAYTCTGRASVDRGALQRLISAGGLITVHGPARCAGNYVASRVSVTLVGAGAGVTLDGGGKASVLVADHARVALSNLTLTHGSGSGVDDPGDRHGAYGGGVSATDSTVTIVACRLVHNRAGDQGGGIHAAKSTVSVTDSTIAGNSSRAGGGGIDTEEDVDLEISGSTITDNTTGPHGGGIEAFDGTLTLTDSTVSGNSVTAGSGFRSGGGLWAGLAQVVVAGSTIRDNSSTEFGGGIGYSGGEGVSLTVAGSAISGNRAALGGGGIRLDAYYGDALLLVNRSTITGNTAGDGGGIGVFALSRHSSRAVLTSSTVARNIARHGLGGGVDSYVDRSGGETTIQVGSTTIDGNRARFGGGIAANGAHGRATISLQPGARLVANVARFHGGGVFTRNGAALETGPAVTMRLNRPDNVG